MESSERLQEVAPEEVDIGIQKLDLVLLGHVWLDLLP